MRLRGSAVLPVLLLSIIAGDAPSQTFEATLLAGDAATGDSLGDAIAISVDTIVAGARADDGGKGAGYVFRRVAGAWSQEAKLTVAGAAAQDQVGSGVGVSGNAAVLGAPDPFDPFGATSGPGRLHVFRRTGSSWSFEQTLSASDGQSLDQLGTSAAIDGDVAIGGAPGDQAAGSGSRFTGRGAAYVFRRTGGVWSQAAKLIPSDAAGGDVIGTSADVSGTGAIVGAPGDDPSGADSGSAYVFRDSGSWSQEQKLTAGGGAASDGFGGAVAIDGAVVVIGAAGHDAGGSNAGAAYVYRKTGASWSFEAKLLASDAAANDAFGTSVDVAGSKIVVGADRDGSGAGAAYVFERIGAAWVETAKVTRSGSVLLGSGVALTSDFVAAGAPLTTGAGVTFSGAAYAWCVNPGPILSGVVPNGGLFHQNTLVTLSGSSFSQVKAKTVTFGAVAATNVTWVANDTVTCLAPTGTQGQTVNVMITQEGNSSMLAGAFTYEGTKILTIAPPMGPSVGGPPITITGNHFVDNGSTVVTFGGVAGSIQSITPPSTMMVAVPAGTRGSTVDVTVTSTNGTDTVVNGFTYDTLSVLSVDVAAAHFAGGTTLAVTIDHPTNLADTSATLGGSPVTVLSVVGSAVNIQTPGIALPNAAALDIGVTNSNGTGTLPGAFRYSPALTAQVTGTAAAGGQLDVTWFADATIAGQVVTLWLGDPLLPPLGVALSGYSGLLDRLPFLFIVAALPEAAGPLALPFGPQPAAVAGFPLTLQALVSGEGAPQGSFSNSVPFVIP